MLNRKNSAPQSSPTNSPGPKTTRRDFLKTTTNTAAAGMTTLGALSIARSAHAAGDGTIKIGMIGCGGRCSGAAS